MRLRFRNPLPPRPDAEKGHEPEKYPELERGGQQPDDDADDSDNNDKFWKLFLEEAVAETQSKVEIWKAELDALLLFVGLFAGVVSAFLIDFRSHLLPDPQANALTELISILRNDTAPTISNMGGPSFSVRAVGFLWYGSLVVTLIGALLGVLAKGWLGEILREPLNNPADGALERWRRDKNANDWYLEHVITGVPLLTQVGLAMFLSGFVVQSFGDNHPIGLEVLVFVLLGVFAYILLTFLPWFRPDCPFRTPLTNILHLVPTTLPDRRTRDANTDLKTHIERTTPPEPVTIHDANRDSKIEILVSRLNRSSSDEIFCAAASMLDVKLESLEAEKWYKGVERKASDVAVALSVRLNSFAHRIEATKMGSSMLKDGASFGAEREAFVGTVDSPIERGILCLRVLLKSIEASMSSDGSGPLWIKQDVDRKWRSSRIFPGTWRLLALSIHITRLVIKGADYEDDIVETDWENMIRETFSDQALWSISGASAGRGLLQGKGNLKRVCALGLAMFIEIEATTSIESPIQTSIAKDIIAKDITKELWSELVNLWKNAVVLLLREAHDWDVEKSFVPLLHHKLYEGDVELSISAIIQQLDDDNWSIRKQTGEILMQLSKFEVFRKTIESKGAIPKLVGKLADYDSDVRAAATAALLAFSAEEIYQSGIKSSIVAIIQQLDDINWRVRVQTGNFLIKLSESDVFREAIESNGAIPKLATKLTDDDSDVRAAVLATLRAFSGHGIYQSSIKSSISAIVQQLDDPYWRSRQQTSEILMELAERDVFRETIKSNGAIRKLADKLVDNDSDVRAAAVAALLAMNGHEEYHSEIKSSISAIIQQLENGGMSEQTAEILMKFSEREVLRNTIESEGAIPKLISHLAGGFEIVRSAAVAALLTFSAQDVFQSGIKASIPTIIQQLDDVNWNIRKQAGQILMKLSESDVFRETIKNSGTIPKLVAKLADGDPDVRATAVAALVAFSAQDTYQSDIKSSISAIILNLDGVSWGMAEQTEVLMKFSELDVFRESIKNNGAIYKIVAELADGDSNVRVAAVAALLAFSAQDIYQSDIKSSISAIFQHLDNASWSIREQTCKFLITLSERDVFRETINSKGGVQKVVARLADGDSDVRAAAVAALQAFSTQEIYQPNIKSSISAIIENLDGVSWGTRHQACIMLMKLSDLEVFRETMQSKGAIPKLVAKLADGDSDVRVAAVAAVLAFTTHELYESDIQLSIPTIIQQMDDDSWRTRRSTVNMLRSFSDNAVFQNAIKTNGFVAKLFAKLDDSDEDVRTAAVEAMSALAANIEFQEEMNAKKLISAILGKFADRDPAVRAAATQALSVIGKEGFYQNDIKSSIPAIIKQVDDKSRSTRQQAIQILTEFSGHVVFHETLKTAGSVNKLVSRLGDNDANVRAAAAQALSSLAAHGIFQETMKAEKAIPKLITKLTDADDRVSSAMSEALLAFGNQVQDDTTEFLQAVMSTLSTIDKPVRMEVYNVLNKFKVLSRDAPFFKDIDTAICDLLTQMKDKDWSFIRRSIDIWSETGDEGLRGEDLQAPGATNKSTRDAVEIFVRSKLVYNRNSPDRNNVVDVISRLAKNEVFIGCMKSAISGLTEAVGDNDRNIWSAAVDAILALSQAEFRADLVPAIQKLIEKLSSWDEEVQYPLNLMEALSTLVDHKEFWSKLKTAVPTLINKLESSQRDARNDAMNQDNDNDTAFFKAACKFISLLCKNGTLGRDLVPYLTRVLPKMHVSLAEDFRDLVDEFISCTSETLTTQDRIALASSLRVETPVQDSSEVRARVCKLSMAAMLDDKARPKSDEDSS